MIKRRMCNLLPLGVCLCLVAGIASAQRPNSNPDVFRGKLFAPNVILERQQALALTDQQLAEIRAAVVNVQSNVAGHQWDMQQAYQRILSGLDAMPIDEQEVLANLDAVLSAENEVKKSQIEMLIKLRNLLSDEQVEYLRSVQEE